MSWNIDLALLIQSSLQIDHGQLKTTLSKDPRHLEAALSVAHEDVREALHRQTIQSDHQRLKDWILKHDLKLTFYGDENYPPSMNGWPRAPQVLWYLGEPVWKKREGLAVVGSRNPSTQTKAWLNWQITDFLRKREVAVISGGAQGVDQASHWAAVRHGTPTVAIMPTGMKDRYPPNFRLIEPAILQTGGAIISPFLPNWPIYKFNFARRNQIIAAMSRVTVIAEARRRSGTLLTAKAAIAQGKPLAVLPCSPMSLQGLGGLDLIMDGAAMIRDAQDLTILWDNLPPQSLV